MKGVSPASYKHKSSMPLWQTKVWKLNKKIPQPIVFQWIAGFLSFVAKKDTSAYVNLMFYSFILRNILSTMCTIADIRWLCYTFNILLPRIQAIY